MVKDTDKGMKAILKEIEKLGLASVDAGFWGNEIEGDSGKTVTDIATINEFGSEKQNIPSRPFMRITADTKYQAWQKQVEKDYNAMLETKGTQGVIGICRKLGEIMANDIRKTIATNIPPPKSPATLKAEGEGHNKTLVDTGQMKASVQSRLSFTGDNK